MTSRSSAVSDAATSPVNPSPRLFSRSSSFINPPTSPVCSNKPTRGVRLRLFLCSRLNRDTSLSICVLPPAWRSSSSPRPCTTRCPTATSGRRRSGRAWTRSCRTPTSPSSTSPTPTAPPSSPRSAPPAAPTASSRCSTTGCRWRRCGPRWPWRTTSYASRRKRRLSSTPTTRTRKKKRKRKREKNDERQREKEHANFTLAFQSSIMFSIYRVSYVVIFIY